jgi:hypothetical protein
MDDSTDVARRMLLLGIWRFATGFGVAHFVIEGAYVCALVVLEMRYVRPFAR